MNVFEMLAGTEIGFASSTARLIVSLVAGGLIGLEREISRQPAGLRTHILICVGSTLLMLLSIYVPQELVGAKNGDPGRIAAQVVTGIGFLGGGAILKIGTNIKGLTTAASIWITSAVGLAIGAGMFLQSGIAVAISLLVLGIFEVVERRVFPEVQTKRLFVFFSEDKADIRRIELILEVYRINLVGVEAEQNVKNQKIRFCFIVKMPVSTDIQRLFREIKAAGEVTKIALSEM